MVDSGPGPSTPHRMHVQGGAGARLEHDPEKWAPVFPRDKREAFARRSCSNKKIERDDESKRSHHALGVRGFASPEIHDVARGRRLRRSNQISQPQYFLI